MVMKTPGSSGRGEKLGTERAVPNFSQALLFSRVRTPHKRQNLRLAILAYFAAGFGFGAQKSGSEAMYSFGG